MFYNKVGEGDFSEEKSEPHKINLNSSDDDSDNSIDRLNGYLDKLKAEGRLNMGGGGGVGTMQE